MIDFHSDNGEAKYSLLKVIWTNKDKLKFTIIRENHNIKCKITLNLGKYNIRAEVPFIRTDRWLMFHVYKRKVFGLYESYAGGIIVEHNRGNSLESLVEDYVNLKVKELKKVVNEAEEAEQRKANAEFIEYLKDNCSTSD